MPLRTYVRTAVRGKYFTAVATALVNVHSYNYNCLSGDKVAIIDKGKLRAEGSPMSLKKQHASGYQLFLEKSPASQGAGKQLPNQSSQGSVISMSRYHLCGSLAVKANKKLLLPLYQSVFERLLSVAVDLQSPILYHRS